MKKDNYKGRSMLTLEEFSRDEIIEIIDCAFELKTELGERGGHAEKPLAGKSIVLFFEKQSLRTRVSFETGIHQLGGQPIYINSTSTHSGRGEPMKDIARVLSRYVHGIIYRAYRHEDVLEMSDYSDVPVINALCNRAHPCQALADLMTIYERRGRGKTKVAYIGDAANNIAASLIITLAKVGIDIALGCPKGYAPDKALLDYAAACAGGGSRIEVFEDPKDAVRGANIVYTDIWVSMGDEAESEERLAAFKGYMVDPEMMDAAAPDARFMHDMPAHRGEEAHEDVVDGDRSIMIDQAENRLHAQKAVMALLMGG